MRAVRLGVLGCSNIAWRRLIPAMQACEDVEVTAVASRSAAKADRYTREFGCAGVVGYEALVQRKDVDAVYVSLPAGMHAEWARRAVVLGKHVLVEKPLATTFDDATDLVQRAKRADLVVAEGFMFPFHSQQRLVRRLLARGVIGNPRLLTASFTFPPLPDGDIRYRADLGGGSLLDAGVYPVRAAHLLLGPAVSVESAWLRMHPERGVDVGGGAMLRTPDGVTADLQWGFEHEYRCCYTLSGTAGRIHVERAFTPPPDMHPPVHVETCRRKRTLAARADDQALGMVHSFACAVRGLDRGSEAASRYDAILLQASLVDDIRRLGGAASVPRQERPALRLVKGKLGCAS